VRVARIQAINRPNRPYVYYLTAIQDKIEEQDNHEDFYEQHETSDCTIDTSIQSERNEQVSLLEKSLHRPLITFLASARLNIHAVTIPHEISNRNDKAQTWTHPDIVGVEFINLTTEASKNLQRAINTSAAFRISSIEVKIRINSDKELKEGFFQAVSNSSWANYGYLAALEFRNDRHIREEMERLNESFGIGFIQISAKPFESKILYPSRYRDLDFKTIDKLCGNNDQFQLFIASISKKVIQNDPEIATLFHQQLINELQKEDIDKPMKTEEEIKKWSLDNNIPWDED
jgi:hypothetical protein